MTPAAIAAASVCWLARWRGDHVGSVSARVTFWHPGTCRFCAEPLEKLLEIARQAAELPQGTMADWHRLPPPARLARIREAQEEAWWDAVTKGRTA